MKKLLSIPTLLLLFSAALATAHPAPGTHSAPEPADTPLHRIVIPSAGQLNDFFHYTPDRLPFVSSHRGGPVKGYPENHPATFEHTMRYSWSMMEMDPHYTKDSALVVMHDPTLDRTSDGHGKISDYTAEQLKQFHLKDPFGNITPYGIPTLDEVIEWSKGKTILVVDAKEVPIDVRVRKIMDHHAETSAIVIAYTFADAQLAYRMDKNIHMEVIIPDSVAVAQFDATGVPWTNVVAFVTHTQPKDRNVFRLIHDRGALCIMGSSRSLDKDFDQGRIKTYADLQAAYKALIAEGADIIEADKGIEAGAAVQSLWPLRNPKMKYFKR